MFESKYILKMRAVVWLFLFLVYCSIPFSLNAQCPVDIGETTSAVNNGLDLYLPMDGNMTNYGSGNYSATLQGGNYVESIDGMGVSFDGVDNYIKVLPSLHLTGDFTITCWVNLNSIVDTMGIFSVRQQCETTYRGFGMAQLSLNDYQVQGLSYQVNKIDDCSTGSGGDRYQQGEPDLNVNEYLFIALTVENNSAENRVVKLYLNCQELETNQVLNQSSLVTFEPGLSFTTTIGSSSTVEGYFKSLNGLMDDFRLYNRKLSFEEIELNYRALRSLQLSVTETEDCNGLYANVFLENAESKVSYQLINLDNQVIVDQKLADNCDVLLETGAVVNPTSFGIRAIHNDSGCELMLDTILFFRPPDKKYFFGEDKEIKICKGDTFSPGGFVVLNDTIYPDTIAFSNLCDSVYLTNIKVEQIPEFQFYSDTTLCEGEILRLDISVLQEYPIIWQDGSNFPFFIVDMPGHYWFSASTICGDIGDTIEVQYVNCDCFVEFPNVFTPNSDGINDEFGPITSCNFAIYELFIFNRWGGLLFKSNSADLLWDGIIKNKKIAQGTYVWVLNFERYGTGLRETLKGTVTVLY